MKREEYTHIRVSKELQGVLKREAEERGMSISNYISDLLKRIQSIEDLIVGDSNVNIGGCTGISLQRALNGEKILLRRGFEPRSWAREAFLDYRKEKKAFEKWMKARCSSGHVDSLLSYLDKYLSEPILNPRRLFELIETVSKGKRQFCMGIRDLLKYYDAFSLMDEGDLLKYRKVVKIPRTNIDNYVPDDNRLISAFSTVKDERYKILFKLLAFSGIRLNESVHLLNIYDANKLITNNTIARYPLNLERGTKRVFYAYIPQKFSDEIDKIGVELVDAQQYIGRRLPAKYIRKWQYNFLISNNVPESVADFIQGRAPSTVGSMHYLAKVKQADEWYAKVVPLLLSLFLS